MAELLPCPFCSGEKVLYQETTHTKLYLDTFGESRVLITECNPYPPYANCCMKGLSANSAFIIKYCPECGRDLNTRTPKERGGEK
jgi:predicted RNA-binding Zn-ribbon protein involved in translation (DUF1610 family)